LLPTLTNVDKPICRSRASERIANPSAPLCDDNAMRPGGGTIGENDAFSFSVVFSTPMQFGPIIRIP
jgi:hypothetical protein